LGGLEYEKLGPSVLRITPDDCHDFGRDGIHGRNARSRTHQSMNRNDTPRFESQQSAMTISRTAETGQIEEASALDE
jgi:hypothetical protein